MIEKIKQLFCKHGKWEKESGIRIKRFGKAELRITPAQIRRCAKCGKIIDDMDFFVGDNHDIKVRAK